MLLKQVFIKNDVLAIMEQAVFCFLFINKVVLFILFVELFCQYHFFLHLCSFLFDLARALVLL